MAAIPTEGRVFVAQLTREIRAREAAGAALLSPGTKTWHEAFLVFRRSLENGGSPVKSAKLLRAAHDPLRLGQRQGACFINFFQARSRSGSFEILTWEVAKHPLLNAGYDGILVLCSLQRDGGGVAGPRTRLAFISWHALARMRRQSAVDIFTAKGMAAMCGIAGYLLQESDRHVLSEINYAADDMVCTGQLRFVNANERHFFDVTTVLPLDEVSNAKRDQGTAIARMVHAYITSGDADPHGYVDAIAVLPCREDDYVSRTLKQNTELQESTG